MTNGGFELQGAEGDETRLLVHTRLGYAIAVPGRPRRVAPTAAAPRYDALLALGDGLLELGVRMDEVPTAVPPDQLAPSLAIAYATSRAADASKASVTGLDGDLLARGADAGVQVNYGLRGEDPQAMEFLAITAKQAPSTIRVLHLSVRYRREDTIPFAWASVRSALLTHQSWTPDVVPATEIWPASAMVAPSVRFELSATATAEARAKAEALGAMSPPMSADEVNRIGDLLLEIAGTNDAPATPLHTFVHELTSRRVAACVPSRVAEVLLRNIADTASMHDLRAWCWQCFWAVGNRNAPVRDGAGL